MEKKRLQEHCDNDKFENNGVGIALALLGGLSFGLGGQKLLCGVYFSCLFPLF